MCWLNEIPVKISDLKEYHSIISQSYGISFSKSIIYTFFLILMVLCHSQGSPNKPVLAIYSEQRGIVPPVGKFCAGAFGRRNEKGNRRKTIEASWFERK